jgi:cell division septum initiation protein DivIVA
MLPPHHTAGGASAALQLENSRLRQAIDRLKARLPALGLSAGSLQQQQQQQQQLRRTGSDVGQPGVDMLREQLAQVRAYVCANTGGGTYNAC